MPVSAKGRHVDIAPPQEGQGCECVDVSAGSVMPTWFRYPGIASQIIHNSSLISSIQVHAYLQEKQPGICPNVSFIPGATDFMLL